MEVGRLTSAILEPPTGLNKFSNRRTRFLGLYSLLAREPSKVFVPAQHHNDNGQSRFLVRTSYLSIFRSYMS